MKPIVQNIMILLLIVAVTGILQGCGGDIWMKKGAAQNDGEPVEVVKDVTFADIPPACENMIEYNFTTRSWPERRAYYQNGAVKHQSLYLCGPYENSGSIDGQYRTVDKDSYIATAASPVIFIANVALCPIAAILNPPWETVESRGYPPMEAKNEIPIFRSQMIDKQSISP